MPKTVKIISWNVNSIRALCRNTDFPAFLAKNKPQFFCMSETKLSLPDQADIDNIEKSVPGYRYRYYNTSRAKQGYSGVAIFCTQKPISVCNEMGAKEFDMEGRSITLEYKDFYLINVYVPNSGEHLKRLQTRINVWDRTLEKYIITLQKLKPVILVGDLNCGRLDIDVHNPKTCVKYAGFTNEERESFDMLLANTKLVDSYRYKYPKKEDIFSYWSYRGAARKKNKGWRIDYCLVNKQMVKNIKSVKIHDDVMGSDHCPVELVLRY